MLYSVHSEVLTQSGDNFICMKATESGIEAIHKNWDAGLGPFSLSQLCHWLEDILLLELTARQRTISGQKRVLSGQILSEKVSNSFDRTGPLFGLYF